MTFIKKSKVLIMSEIENLCFIESIKKSLVMFFANTFLYIRSTYITKICATAYFAMFSVSGCILSQPN